VYIDGETYDVDVDIMAGMYGGTQKKKRSQHVQGIKALKATGGNFAFKFEPQKVKIEAKRTDGAIDVARINVIGIVPYFVMKAAAMGRGKSKDAYDIYFLIRHFDGGPSGLAELFRPYKNLEIIRNMMEKMNEKFASQDHVGPVDVAKFMDLDDAEEEELVKRDVYEQVQELLRLIRED